MATQHTQVLHKGDDAELGAVSVTSLDIGGTPISATTVLLGGGDLVDLNGEADALVLDADADTTISSPTDDQIDIEIASADDFRFTANTFTALSGSTIATNTIAETTAGSGVTIDGLLVKDGGILLPSSGYIDLNGETGAIVFDADANTKIAPSADNVITITVSAADDFTISANTLTALSGSTIATNTIAETTAASGVTVDGLLIKDAGLTVGTSGVIALNGEADALTLDSDGNTSISAPTGDQIDIEIAGADDFRFVANIFRALSGSSIETNTINETTAASGVTIDSVVVKDGGLTLGTSGVLDLNGEADALTLDADGNTSISAPTDNQIDIEVNGADDFTITANTFTALSGSSILTNTISETTAASGVTIDGLLIKDGIVGTIQAITGDGAITIQNATVVASKGSAAALTLAAPTAGTHDGIQVRVVATSAQAHVITGGVDGFNAKGASGTATFGGAIGDSVTFVAHNGHWYTLSKVNVTIA
jgi:hypothetical protein